MLSKRAFIYYLQSTIRSYNYLKVAQLKCSKYSMLCKAVLVLLKAVHKAMLKAVLEAMQGYASK